MSKASEFEVVIAGGGMVGLALACALGRRGVATALVEAQEPRAVRSQDATGLRVSALSRASQRILANLGAWDAVRAVRVSPYQGMQVWDAAGGGRVSFDAADIGEPDLGHIVENGLIQYSLWECARSLESVTLFAPDKAARLDIRADHARLVLDSGRELKAALVVGADGAASRIRGLAGIGVTEDSYGQFGVVTHITTQRPHGAIARQRFLADGPLALLPLADGRCSIVWSTTPGHSEALLEMPEAEFCAAVTEASETVLGEVTACAERARFPLRRLHAERYFGERVALVGDAAHVVHPLAGQGVNLGFLDAAVLAEELVQARAAARDPGEPRRLRRYERRRRGENLLVQASLDGFHRLFTRDEAPLHWLRSTGMRVFEQLQPLKRKVIRQAMGLEGDLPELAR